jgi:uncharacterized repeat protein (TIGR01451 family)
MVPGRTAELASSWDQLTREDPMAASHFTGLARNRDRENRNTAAAPRRGRARKPRIEGLETRCLLSVTITEFPLPAANSSAQGIVLGPDGNLWFTEAGVPGVSGSGNKIGQINPTTHVVTEFPVPTANSSPQGIASGPDGNLWFTEAGVPGVSRSGNKIGEINPTSHVFTEFPIPTANSSPQGITAGPDGNVWFTEGRGNKIGQINLTTHVIAEFPIPNNGTNINAPNRIAAGPDGDLWFTTGTINSGIPGAIGEINPRTHDMAVFPLQSSNVETDPIEIAAGPDGNLWFTIENAGAIGEINPRTDIITQFPLPSGQAPIGITTGPDGNLWFAVEIQGLSNGYPQIGEINPASHAIAEIPVPTFHSEAAQGITAGPDGNVWFTEPFGTNIGQVVLTTQATAPDLALSGNGPSSVNVGADATYSLTVTNNGTAGATGVTLTDTLPNEVGFVSATGGVTPVDGALDFKIGSLPAGASSSVTIVVTATAARTLTDSATASMSQTEPTPADNSVTLTTSVSSAGAADLALSGSAPTLVSLGKKVTYSLHVTNDGRAGATGVTLTDTLPAGVKFVSATGGVRRVKGVLSFPIGSLAAGATATITIVVTPTAAGKLQNHASVRGNESEPTPADNSVTQTTTVNLRVHRHRVRRPAHHAGAHHRHEARFGTAP